MCTDWGGSTEFQPGAGVRAQPPAGGQFHRKGVISLRLSPGQRSTAPGREDESQKVETDLLCLLGVAGMQRARMRKSRKLVRGQARRLLPPGG